MAAATAAVTAFAKASIDTGAQFDSSMSQVAATMGTTVDKIQELRDFAMDMGAKTAFSATQAADALNYMALAGYDAEQSMQALPNVLNLAAAGGIDLARASDMVTDAQSALGLSMEESTELIDKMAAASSRSNTSVAQLGDAILTIGGTAKNLAGGTTELATALGILADNGIKGAEGGTALRNIILSLSAPTDKAAKKLEELGVQVYDAEGNMRPLNETFSDLQEALSTMTQGEQTQVLNELFNKVDLKSVNALLANTGARFDELSGYIDNATGAAEAMANTQLDNFAGDVTLLQSAVEGVQIALSDKLTPALREGIQFMTGLAGSAQEFIENGGIDQIIQQFTDLSPVIAAATAAFVAYKAATAISGIMEALTKATEEQTIAQAALNAIMNANPFVLVATLIAAVGAALVTLYMTNEDFRNKVNAAWEKIRTTISGAVSSIVEFFTVTVPNAAQNALDWFNSIPTKMRDVGKNIVEGLWNGIYNMAGWISDKIKGFGDGVLNALKDFFGIKSPSRVFRDVVGKNLALGLAEGIEDEADSAATAAARMALDVWDGFESEYGRVRKNIEGAMDFGAANMDFSAGNVDFASSGLGRSTAGIINSGTDGEGGGVISLTINLLTGDAQPFAQWMLPDLISAANAAGTPIASGQYA